MGVAQMAVEPAASLAGEARHEHQHFGQEDDADGQDEQAQGQAAEESWEFHAVDILSAWAKSRHD